MISDHSTLGCWGPHTSRIQNKEVYATLCIQAQLGIDPTICMIIVSLGRKNLDALLDAAQDLGPKLGLEGALARSLMNLANSWSKESGRQGIKMFINTVSDSSKAGANPFVNLDKDSPFDGEDDPDIQKTVQILPEIAEAMLAITEDQDFVPLVQLLNTPSGKIVRDAFKPVPMQVFRLIQNIFIQDDEAVRSNSIRVMERLMIADACSVNINRVSVGISKIVERLAYKLEVDSQLASVLAAIMERKSKSMLGASLAQATKGTAGNAFKDFSRPDFKMLEALFNSNDEPTNEFRSASRPVQAIKNWLKRKIVNKHGKVEKDGEQFVLIYQMLCLIDGVFNIWMQRPADIRTCDKFCREILSMEPSVAGALLALMNSEEGGVNPEISHSGSENGMRQNVIEPLSRQLLQDVGHKMTDEEAALRTTDTLLHKQVSQALSAFFSMSRGRRVDYIRLAILSGIPRETSLMVGMLLNGQLKAPLWKQVTPLCNKLGITESKIVIAFMQLRRQEVMNDYQLAMQSLLPWLTPMELMNPEMQAICRWIVQLASDSHLDLDRAPYLLYGVKYIDLVSLAPVSGRLAKVEPRPAGYGECLRPVEHKLHTTKMACKRHLDSIRPRL